MDRCEYPFYATFLSLLKLGGSILVYVITKVTISISQQPKYLSDCSIFVFFSAECQRRQQNYLDPIWKEQRWATIKAQILSDFGLELDGFPPDPDKKERFPSRPSLIQTFAEGSPSIVTVVHWPWMHRDSDLVALWTTICHLVLQISP